jgi:hypothetical protein
MFTFDAFSDEDQTFIKNNLNRVFEPSTDITLPSGHSVRGGVLNAVIVKYNNDLKPDFDTSLMVPKHYLMNPETDEVVPNGFKLLNGMSVLIENPTSRVDPKAINGYGDYNLTLERNCWCEVSHLTIWNNERVTFVGIYENGVKIHRDEPVKAAWLVWIDSIPEYRDAASEPEYIDTGIPESTRRALKKYETMSPRERELQRLKHIPIPDPPKNRSFRDYMNSLRENGPIEKERQRLTLNGVITVDDLSKEDIAMIKRCDRKNIHQDFSIVLPSGLKLNSHDTNRVIKGLGLRGEL